MSAHFEPVTLTIVNGAEKLHFTTTIDNPGGDNPRFYMQQIDTQLAQIRDSAERFIKAMHPSETQYSK